MPTANTAYTVNIGILAHVDAGKTSLTERLLYDTGVTGRLGRVDAGTTRTDDTAVERRRGITVRSAVAALPVPYGQVNLIDTPGHSEFVAEVERVLGVLDGAILVVSAADGVQPQTRVLMRTLRRLGLPTLIFINKIDRAGARHAAVLADIRRRLTPDIVAMTTLTGAGTPEAAAAPYDPADPEFTTALSETLADHDEALLARVVDGPPPDTADLAAALTAQTAAGHVHPVYAGSAITGAGVPALLDAVTRFFPAPGATGAPDATGPKPGEPKPAGTSFAVRRGPGGEKPESTRPEPVGPERDATGPEPDRSEPDTSERGGPGPDPDRFGAAGRSEATGSGATRPEPGGLWHGAAGPEPGGAGPVGTFFAVRRGPGGEKVAYLRLFAGELRRRARVTFWRPDGDEHTGRITGLRVVGPDLAAAPAVLGPGGIAEVRGLPEVRTGDRIGPRPDSTGAAAAFAGPGLEAVVRARRETDAGRLHAALRVLADGDPFVIPAGTAGTGVRLRLYGEVQKEIIATTLAEEFGVDVVFAPSRAVYLERPAGCGEAAEVIGEREPVDFWATIGLRVAPGPAGSGVEFGRDTELGALPRAFDRAIETTVREVLEQGLYGWPVTDCVVTLTRSGYIGPLSVAADFRGLTPLVLMRALAAAGTGVYEPVHAFEAEVPADTVGTVAARLAGLAGALDGCAAVPSDPGTWLLTGTLPARHVHTVQTELPGLSRGDGAWWSRPAGDRPVPGSPPRRSRTGADPLNRAAYLRERA